MQRAVFLSFASALLVALAWSAAPASSRSTKLVSNDLGVINESALAKLGGPTTQPSSADAPSATQPTFADLRPTTRPALSELNPTTQPSESIIKAAIRTEHVAFAPSDLRWGPAPNVLPPGAQMSVLSGDPTGSGPFAVRLKVPANYRIPPHWHPTDEGITVISGTLYVGDGDTLNPSSAKELPPGGFALMPAKMHHYAFSKDETIIQINSMGPFAITYINPADNPAGQNR